MLKALGSGEYGKIGSAPMSNIMPDIIRSAQASARQGKIIDIGQMTYAQSKKSANAGLQMLESGYVRHPFETPWWVIGETSFKKGAEPQKTIAMAWQREEGVYFAEAAVTNRQGVALWYLATMRPDHQLQIHYDAFPENMRIAMAQSEGSDTVASNYAAGMNAIFAAVAICNTRGIDYVERKATRTKKGLQRAPYTQFDTRAYFTAIDAPRSSSEGAGGTHASPIPHIRRGHVRNLPNGETRWINEALVNVRSEGDLAFVEQRQAYITREYKEC